MQERKMQPSRALNCVKKMRWRISVLSVFHSGRTEMQQELQQQSLVSCTYHKCQLTFHQGKLGVAKISYLGGTYEGLRSEYPSCFIYEDPEREIRSTLLLPLEGIFPTHPSQQMLTLAPTPMLNVSFLGVLSKTSFDSYSTALPTVNA